MPDDEKIKNSNAGFTLVELIVSFAILAIVFIMIALIIQSSGSTYSRISGDINLQYESQMALSQLQDDTIDCSTAIAVTSDSGTLYIFNKLDDTRYEAYKFTKSPTSDELVLYSKESNSSFNQDDPSIFSFGTAELMSSYVTQFTAVSTTDALTGKVKSVSVTVSYSIGNKTYVGHQTIALRNSVDNISVYAH